MSDGITQHIRCHLCGWCCIIPPDEDDEDEFPTRPGQLPSSASLLVEYIGKFRSIPIPERDRMLCHGMHWDGKRSLTLRVRSGKQFLCFTNNIKVMTRFCLSRLKQALSVPDSVRLVLIFSTSSGGNRRGMQRIERSDQARAGLTDWLTGWRTVMRCLRMHYDWVSNLIVYTNFIYVTWVHFVLYPRACTVGWKFPVHPVPEWKDRKWSVSAICNAFSRFSIGNVWISDAISGKGKSRK